MEDLDRVHAHRVDAAPEPITPGRYRSRRGQPVVRVVRVERGRQSNGVRYETVYYELDGNPWAAQCTQDAAEFARVWERLPDTPPEGVGR